MSTILITGGTGLIGSALTPQLVSLGHEVTIVSRKSKPSTQKNVSYATWDVKAQTIDASAIAKADYIIHLAGASVADKRWTKKRKREIVESRTESSKLLIKALGETQNKVKAVISASAIGWYGGDENAKVEKRAFTEEDPADTSFLGETCRLWEDSIQAIEQTGVRLVKLRTGIVLCNEGGALAEFKKPVQFGIGGVLGSGKQVISWIHIEDLCRMYMYAIENEALKGVYNAVAPAPVTNKELTVGLAQKMKGSFYIPLHVPAFVLKTMLGEMSIEVLKSSTVSADKIQAAGFSFLYPTINEALEQLIKEEKKR
jgi:uncharacterized protein (TIGR01777 family)